ncbi:MAG: putative toxin-antitoxin system toxin component, PIN family [Isosphaeraceae bacterium]
MMTRVIFDCMVLLQAAARSQGPAAECLRLVEAGRLKLFLSPAIVAEVRDVLTRPRTLKKFPTLTPEAVHLFLQDLQVHAAIMDQIPHRFSLPRDPKDEPYLNLAIEAGARYLVSRDRDLLDLMTDEAFRRSFPDLVILDPVELLRWLAEKSSDSSNPKDHGNEA